MTAGYLESLIGIIIGVPVAVGVLWWPIRGTYRLIVFLRKAAAEYEEMKLVVTSLNCLCQKELNTNGGKSLKDYVLANRDGLKVMFHRMNMIWEMMESAVFECDHDGQCVWASDRLCRLFGLDRGEMVGNGWLQAIEETDRLRVWGEWTKTTQQGVPFSCTYTVVNQETGEVVRCRAFTVTTHNEKHLPIAYFGVVKPLD